MKNRTICFISSFRIGDPHVGEGRRQVVVDKLVHKLDFEKQNNETTHLNPLI
jgi:hypothetical protein